MTRTRTRPPRLDNLADKFIHFVIVRVGIHGGKGGYSGGTSSDDPWKEQAPYLTDIFSKSSEAYAPIQGWSPYVTTTNNQPLLFSERDYYANPLYKGLGIQQQAGGFVDAQGNLLTQGSQISNPYYDQELADLFSQYESGGTKLDPRYIDLITGDYFEQGKDKRKNRTVNPDAFIDPTPAGPMGYYNIPYEELINDPGFKYMTATQAPQTDYQIQAREAAAQRAITGQMPTTIAGQTYNRNPLLVGAQTAMEGIISGENQIGAPQIDYTRIGNVNPRPYAAAGDTNLSFANIDDLNAMIQGGHNPYLDQMVEATTRDMTKNYLENVVPYLTTSAEMAGRGDSFQTAKSKERAANDYLTSIGDVNASIRGTAYESDRNRALQALGLSGDLAKTEYGGDLETALQNAMLRDKGMSEQYGFDTQRALEQANMDQQVNTLLAQLGMDQQGQNIQNVMSAAQFVPQLADMDYADIERLAAVGSEEQAFNQALLDSARNWYNFQQMSPQDELAMYSNLLGGNYGGTVTSSQESGGK